MQESFLIGQSARRPAGITVARARRSGMLLWGIALGGAAILIAIHLALAYVLFEVFDPRLLFVDLAVAAVALLPAAWYISALTEERQRYAAEGLLLEVLANPRNIEDTAAEALDALIDHGVASSGAVALAEDTGELAYVIAAAGFPDGWARHAPPVALMGGPPIVEREDDDEPWLAALNRGYGGRPWVARIPLMSGNDPIGLLMLVGRNPGSMRDARLMEMIGNQLSAALDHAALYEAAYRRERDLEEQDVRRREFMAAISHEIRTPLTSIQAFADLLQMDTSVRDESAEQLVTSLTHSVDRLNRLVGDLIDLGRSGGQQYELRPSEGDVRELLWQAESMLRPAFLLREQPLSIEAPEDPVHAYLDHRHLEQVVLSLLSNANRHAPAGGWVAVRVREVPDRRIQIEVEDSGPGIDLASRDRIFDPYFRVTSVDGVSVPGSGLGLAIAKRLIELQGGRIWVETGDEGGARFCVEVPDDLRGYTRGQPRT